jgi:hypothetical protein
MSISCSESLEFPYPAISRSTKGSISNQYTLLDFPIPGFGPQKSERCNQPNYVRYCDDCKHTDVHSYHCNRWDCPVCYPWTASKAARSVADRLWGVSKAYMKMGEDIGYINHLMLSVPESEYEGFDLEKQKKLMRKYAKDIGLTGGAVIFHPWRLKGVVEDCFHELRQVGLKGGNWDKIHKNILKGQSGIHLGIEFTDMSDYIEFGPHWHIIGYFRIKEKSNDFFARTGWTYKNITMEHHRPPLDKNGIKGTIQYLCTHHCVFPGKQSITYFGVASPNKVHCAVKVQMEFAKCPDCYVKHNVLDLSGAVVSTNERGILWKIPVKGDNGVNDLQRKIDYREFKFNPKDYFKAFDYRVTRFYTVITHRVLHDPKKPVYTSKAYSYCNKKKYYL